MKKILNEKCRIISFVLVILWIFLVDNMKVDSVVDYVVLKICELIGKGFLMWLISSWILCKSKSKILGTVIVVIIGLALTLIPQYIDILKWSLETSRLALKMQIEVVNYIFLDKFIGKYIWRTIFWPMYYLVIYYLSFLSQSKKESKSNVTSSK